MFHQWRYLLQKLARIEHKRQEQILHTHIENLTWSGGVIAEYFKFPKFTINPVLKRHQDTLSLDRTYHNNCRIGIYDRKQRMKVRKAFRNIPEIFVHDLTKRIFGSYSTLRRIMTASTPKGPRTQPNAARECGTSWNFGQLSEHTFYHSKRKGAVPDRFKFVYVDKFAHKLMYDLVELCSCGKKNEGFHHQAAIQWRVSSAAKWGSLTLNAPNCSFFRTH